MKPTNESCMPGSCDYWMVSQAAAKLGIQASTLGARHIKDGTLRLQFNREVSYYARGIVNDVSQGNKSAEQGLKELKDEQNSLLSQARDVALRGASVISGALQFAAGAGICYASVGTLCLFAGAPMMLNGANNTYESGRNLFENRSDTVGPLRTGYRAVSGMLGKGNCEADVAYGMVDLSSSAYGIGRMVLKPDAWRLFRYVNTDYVRGYQQAARGGFIFDRLMDSATVKTMYSACHPSNE
ncbi:DUF4225 domain-containing protein [Pseudomonas sp. P5_152]|uniref:DUF4225 domain-containing protein n=1 Tax=Pseudomonas sp. P5_152 TaxID=3043442 RepID=UPI002A37078C|nr:DUF4225 domain-containing protein [Pseudomonas sp. P5_152]MDX9663572.1 DUF4225 domain-containing protein [Pseudomonas sp. P5_152]